MMHWGLVISLFIAGGLVGIGLGWLLGTFRSRLQTQRLEQQVEAEQRITQEKIALLQSTEERLADTFKALSSEAMKSNNESFLQLAKTTLEKYQEGAKSDLEKRQDAIDHLMKPVKDSLEKFNVKIQDLEKARVGAYEVLKEQVANLANTHRQLQTETANLAQALKSPTVRGRWGEFQLKRVVEMAGMMEHCDFFQQETVTHADGRLRPDLIVRLPGDKRIVVDAKAPLSAYLEALETNEESVRKDKMQQHAKHIRGHIQTLSRKNYWDQFKPSPEFVVLFLPGEIFFSAALEQDPSLIEMGVEQNVILATPTTLIALLRAVAYGWRQENAARNAQVITQLGQDLYRRLGNLTDHFGKVGTSLQRAVEAYNKSVGTLENRVLASARKFKELDSTDQSAEIANLEPVETTARRIEAPELRLAGGTSKENG